MKRYNISERVQLAKVIKGVRDLSRHTDAYLAEVGQVHRGNVTSFNAQKRPHSLSTRTIDELLEHYGFVYTELEGIKPIEGEHCPRITLRTEFDTENTSLKDFANALKKPDDLMLCHIENQLGDFALIWSFEDVTQIKGWCAVGLGLGANNSVAEQFLANGVAVGPSFRVDEVTYKTWLATSPRKSEVLGAYARSFRSATLAKNIERAMPAEGVLSKGGIGANDGGGCIL